MKSHMSSSLSFIFLDLLSRLFPSVSPDTNHSNILFIQYLIFSAFIVLIVGGALLIITIKFRARSTSNSEETEERKPVYGHKQLEIAWTVLPLIAVIVFFVLAVKVIRKIEPPPKKDFQPDLVIIAS